MTDRLIGGLERKGYSIVSPRDGEQSSGIASFNSAVHDHLKLWRTLTDERKTEIVVREGRLRCSAHFYNTEEQMDRLVERLPGH